MIKKKIRSILIYSICFPCIFLISLNLFSCKEKSYNVVAKKNGISLPSNEIRTYFSIPTIDKGNVILEDCYYSDFINCDNLLILLGIKHKSFKTYSISQKNKNSAQDTFSQSDLVFNCSKLPAFLVNENQQYSKTISVTNLDNNIFTLVNKHHDAKDTIVDQKSHNQDLRCYSFKEQSLKSIHKIPDLLNLDKIRIFNNYEATDRRLYLIASSREYPDSLLLANISSQEPILNFEILLKTESSIDSWELHGNSMVVLLSDRTLLRYIIKQEEDFIDASQQYSVKFRNLGTRRPQIYFSEISNLYLIWDSINSGQSFYHVENNSNRLFLLPYQIQSVIPLDKTSQKLNIERKKENSFLILNKEQNSEDTHWDIIGIKTISKELYLETYNLKNNE